MTDTDSDRQPPEAASPEAIEAAARLERGERGVAVHIPRDWPSLGTLGEESLWVEDLENGVQWAVVHSVFPLTLAPGDDGVLAEDVKQSARLMFDAESAMAQEVESWTPLDITANPTWSPLIDMEVRRQGPAALVVVHRLAHHVGREVVTGRVLIPTTHGLTELECRAHDAMSGIRAALVMTRAPEGQRPKLALTDPKGAALIDDARNDAFSTDALSRVRRGLRWLFSPDGGNLRILSPGDPRDERGPVVAEGAGCSFVLPPRYARLRARLSADPAIAVFARVTGSVLLSQPWSLDVYRLSPSGGAATIEGLRGLAENNVRSWEAEGVAIKDFASRAVAPRKGYLELRSMVRHHGSERAFRSLQHWIWRTSWIPGRGALWRITISIDDGIPSERFEAELDAVAASWRPI